MSATLQQHYFSFCRPPRKAEAVTGSPHLPSPIDWSGIAPHVAEALLGPHNARLSSRTEWRWGSKGSLQLYLDSGRWTDWESSSKNQGILDLVIRETGCCSPSEALAWLREQGFLLSRAAAKHTTVAERKCTTGVMPEGADLGVGVATGTVVGGPWEDYGPACSGAEDSVAFCRLPLRR